MAKRRKRRKVTPDYVKYACREIREKSLSSLLAQELRELNSLAEREIVEKNKKRIADIEKVQEIREELSKQLEDEDLESLTKDNYKHDLYFQKNMTKKVEGLKAYIIRFKNHPEFVQVAFAINKTKAEGAGYKALRLQFFPNCNTYTCPVNIKEAKSKRCAELDKFAGEDRIPIPELLKVGITFKCSLCGRYKFTYQDYIENKCFIIEGEGEVSNYTKGMIVCSECRKKHFF